MPLRARFDSWSGRAEALAATVTLNGASCLFSLPASLRVSLPVSFWVRVSDFARCERGKGPWVWAFLVGLWVLRDSVPLAGKSGFAWTGEGFWVSSIYKDTVGFLACLWQLRSLLASCLLVRGF